MRQFGIPGARDEGTARHTGRHFAAGIVGVVIGVAACGAYFGIGRTGTPPANPKLCAICAELQAAASESGAKATDRRDHLRGQRNDVIAARVKYHFASGPIEFDCPGCDAAYTRMLREKR